jgi:hypothetical protein
MNISNSDSKKSFQKNEGDNFGTSNYINKSNIINENSSDNDIENSNINVNDSQSNDLYIKEFRRLTVEYIKVLGIYQKEKEGEIDMNEIMDEFKIPREIIEEKVENENSNKEQSENLEEENMAEDEIGFDNDIQPPPSLDQDMKTIIDLTKPKIIGFDGKLGLFYVSPPPVGEEGNYSLIVKNPQNMKNYYKIKIFDLITCSKKNEYCIQLLNFGSKISAKTNHQLTFKNKAECEKVYQGITFLMNNKDDDVFY